MKNSDLEKRFLELENRLSLLEEKLLSLNKISEIKEPHQEHNYKIEPKLYLEYDNLYIELRDLNSIDNLLNYFEALQRIGYLNKIKYAGFEEWRLPNKKELEKLMKLTKSNNLIIMPNKFQPIFWSSTEDSESPKVWVANFKHRYGNFAYKRHSYYSIAVITKN